MEGSGLEEAHLYLTMIVLFILSYIYLTILPAVPRDSDFAGISKDLHDIDGVRTVHNINVWALTLDKTVVSAHLAVGKTDPHSQQPLFTIFRKRAYTHPEGRLATSHQIQG